MNERGPFLRWQWSNYPATHRDRRNLALHALSWPIFLGGTCAIAAAPVVGIGSALAGAAALALVIIAQGRGHKLEGKAPAPFRGPLDLVQRLFVEQWVTFPRYLLSGGFAKAWRESGAEPGMAAGPK